MMPTLTSALHRKLPVARTNGATLGGSPGLPELTDDDEGEHDGREDREHDLHRCDVGRVEPRADQVLGLRSVAGRGVLRRAELAQHRRGQSLVGGDAGQARLFLDRVGQQRTELGLDVGPQAVGQVTGRLRARSDR